jgi:hypothetical protein
LLASSNWCCVRIPIIPENEKIGRRVMSHFILYCYADYERYEVLEERYGRFHAQWRR